MKKILICFFVSIGFIGVGFGQSLDEYVKSNYEYIKSQDQLLAYKSYETSQNNEFMLVGNYFYSHEVDSVAYLQNLIRDGILSNDLLFFINDDKYFAMDMSKNDFSTTMCEKLNSSIAKLLVGYTDIPKLLTSDYIFFLEKQGIDVSCYTYADQIYIPIRYANGVFDFESDITYFQNNYEHIVNIMDNIAPINDYQDQSLNLLKGIYRYIARHTSYAFDIVASSSPDSIANTYPWKVSSFFQGKNLVCDGYTKTFIFIAAYLGIKAEKVVGDIQPIENISLNAQGFLHSWAKIGDLHFDPTFDDVDANDNFDYFAQTKTCMNLNHYMSGWALFQTPEQRYEYIIQNSDYLIRRCPGILEQSLLKDGTFINYVKFTLQEYDLDINKKFLCDTLGICNINAMNKADYITDLGRYKITLASGNTVKEYDFQQVLANIQAGPGKSLPELGPISLDNIPTTPNLVDKGYELTTSKKQKIQAVVSLLVQKLKKYPLSKRVQYFNTIKKKLEYYRQKYSDDEKNLAIVDYLDAIFSIEKIY